MNYRTILLASAAVMFAGSAMAADLTGALYLPNKGQLTSNTSYEYGRTQIKHRYGGEADKDASLAEEIVYGVTDNFAVKATLENDFDANGDYNNDHNFVYNIGAAYNMNYGKFTTQVAADYITFSQKDFYGSDYRELEDSSKWVKILRAQLKVGYDMGNGLSPYAIYGIMGNVDTGDRYLDQSFTLGLHKYAGKWAADAALRYDFNTDGQNTNTLWGLLEGDYYATDNIALGLYGEYFLDGTGSHYIKYDYTLGARVKVLF